MEMEDIIARNDFIKELIEDNPKFREYLTGRFQILGKNNIKNINSLQSDLKNVNEFENLIPIIGKLNFCVLLTKCNINEIDVSGKKLPSGRKNDVALNWDNKIIYIEIKSPIKELNELFETDQIKRIYDEEELKRIAVETIEDFE